MVIRVSLKNNSMNKYYKDQQDPRYEIKIFLENTPMELITQYLSLNPASFRKEYDDRYINNLYLDDHNLSSFHDNTDGSTVRRKIRLRWYGEELHSKNMILEFKNKRGSLNFKNKYCIGHDIDLKSQSWNKIILAIHREIPLSMKPAFEVNTVPVVITKYLRSYYSAYGGKLRLTIDRKLSFLQQLNTIKPNFSRPLYFSHKKVIELKADPCDQNLLSEALQYFPFQVTKSSKYVAATSNLGIC